MCLGDIRFAPYLRWRRVMFNATTAWQQCLWPDASRVGIILLSTPSNTNTWRTSLAPYADGGAQSGGITVGANPNTVELTYAKWGEIVRGPWWVYTSVAWGATYPLLLEFLAPVEHIEEIRRMGLRQGFPSNAT